jgi:hypothetical protein
MRFLLTSAGINNTSIHDAPVDLLGKPIAESNALCIRGARRLRLARPAIDTATLAARSGAEPAPLTRTT